MTKLDSAIAQAKRYGRLIAYFDENRMEDDSVRTKRAWKFFKTQFSSVYHKNAIVNGFYDGYYTFYYGR